MFWVFKTTNMYISECNTDLYFQCREGFETGLGEQFRAERGVRNWKCYHILLALVRFSPPKYKKLLTQLAQISQCHAWSLIILC